MVGSAALIRVSSVICWSASNGTLKSTRASTRFPATSISRIVFLFISLQAFLCNEVSEVSDAARVAPLVVVPRDNLDHVTAKNHRREPVHNRRMRVAPEVSGDQGLLCVIKDTI